MIEFPNEEAKWTWLAGFMDADCSVQFNKIKDATKKREFRWRPTVDFRQTNLNLVKQVVRIFGGGSIYKGKTDFGSPIYATSIRPRLVRETLPKVLPYLIKKKQEAILLLEALTLLSQHKHNHTPHDKRLQEIWEILANLHIKGHHSHKSDKTKGK